MLFFEFPLVHIESSQPIKGVFIQGRKKNGNEPIGTFINIPPETHLVKCPTVSVSVFRPEELVQSRTDSLRRNKEEIVRHIGRSIAVSDSQIL